MPEKRDTVVVFINEEFNFTDKIKNRWAIQMAPLAFIIERTQGVNTRVLMPNTTPDSASM